MHQNSINNLTKLNTTPLELAGLSKEELRGVLNTLIPALQVLIYEELGDKIDVATRDKLELDFADKPLDLSIEYSRLYQMKTGKYLENFINSKFNDLIKFAAKFIVKQKKNLELIMQLDESEKNNLVKLVRDGKFDEAEELIQNE